MVFLLLYSTITINLVIIQTKPNSCIKLSYLDHFWFFGKNAAGEIIKEMPIRIAKAKKIKIVAEPEPSSNQLIKGNGLIP